MEQYIIFFDIDGTLLHVPSGHKQPSIYLKKAIHQLQENGHLCFIATGRTYAYLNKEILNLNFDGYITCNGAVVLKDDNIIISHYFPRNIIEEILQYLEENNNSYTLCAPKKAHALLKYKEIFEVFNDFGVPKENISTEIDLDKIKVAKFEITAKNDEVVNFILDLSNDGFEIVSHGFNIFEINMPNVSKGKSILELLEKINIPIKNSIAFGDGNNDIEMLQIVGRGVAMGNGSEAAKEAADVITESVSDEGIVRELQRLGLVKDII